MSVFGKLFGSFDDKSTNSKGLKWNLLTDIKQLDAIAEDSASTPVLIFKHSTRCSVSRMALRTFENEYNIEEDKAEPYFLDLLEHRDISNAIASRFGVTHQSPQLILIKGGQAVYHSSHSDIDANTVKGKL